MRDRLALGLGLARAGWRLAAERLRQPLGVDAAWLTAALQESFPGVRVGSVARLGGDAGTTDRARLALTYATTGATDAPPSSVFVKLPPRDLRTRLFVDLLRLGATEARFYRDVAAAAPVRTPRAYHADPGSPGPRFALVLEDLGAGRVRFTDVAASLGVDEARQALTALARLHAAYWASPRLAADLGWLKAPVRNPHLAVERALCAAAVRPALARWGDVVPPAVRDAAARLAGARDRLEAAWACGPLTLVHGDCHGGNLFFTAEGVGLLDWQVTQHGQGMRDVTYLLVTSLPRAVRREHERALIAQYLSALRALGTPAPDRDTAWEQYRLHACYVWYAAVVTAAATTLQSAAIARTGLARAAWALIDCEALTALERLGA